MKKTAFLLCLLAIPYAFAWDGGKNIDDQFNVVYDMKTITTDNRYIWVDANGNGEITDDEDYVLYNELFLSDSTRIARVKLVYKIEPGPTDTFEDFTGEIIEIRGKTYLVTQARDYEISLGENFTEKKLLKVEKITPDTAIEFIDGIKMGISGDPDDFLTMGYLWIIYNETVYGLLDLDNDYAGGRFQNKTDISYRLWGILPVLKNYTVFITNSKPGKTRVAIVKNEDIIKLFDGQKDVLGYDEVKLNDDDFKYSKNKIKFLSKLYEVEKSEKEYERVEDARPYKMQFNYRNRFRILVGSFPKTVKTAENKSSTKSWKGKYLKDVFKKIFELNEVKLYSNAVKVDANEDGDVYDPEDYVLYNQLYVLDGSKDAKVRLVYNIQPKIVTADLEGPFRNLAGMTVTIRDEEYLITYAEENKLELGSGPVIKTLHTQNISDLTDNATGFIDDIKMSYIGGWDKKGTLYIIKNESTTGPIDMAELPDKGDITYKTGLSDYVVYLLNSSSRSLDMAVIKKENIITIFDGQKDVFRYVIAKVNNEDFADGRNKVKFLSKLYTIPKGNESELEDARPYKMQFNTKREFRIVKGTFPKKEDETTETAPVENETEHDTFPEEKEENLTNNHQTNQTSNESGLSMEEKFESVGIDDNKTYPGISYMDRDVINRYIESSDIPGPLKGFVSGRYIVHIDNETFSLVIDDGRIKGIVKGEIENPSNEIWTTKETIENISKSEDPIGALLDAQKRGDLKKEDHGTITKIKGFMMSILLKIASYFE